MCRVVDVDVCVWRCVLGLCGVTGGASGSFGGDACGGYPEIESLEEPGSGGGTDIC